MWNCRGWTVKRAASLETRRPFRAADLRRITKVGRLPRLDLSLSNSSPLAMSDQDEFDKYYGDSLDDESLAQVELLASQHQQSLQASHHPPAHSILPSSSRPAKRQKLDLVPSQPAQNHSPQRPLAPSHKRRHSPTPAPNDFEIAHRGPGRPPALGAGHGETLNHWGNSDYFTVDDSDGEQPPAEAPSRTMSKPLHSNAADLPLQTALEQLRKENQSMQDQLKAALADVKERTNRMYARDGEIKIVRERNERAERDLAELRSALQKSKEDFQKHLEEREKFFAAERDRMDTNAAFHRLEAETSAKRTPWPGSARRRMARGPGASSQAFPESSYHMPPPVAPTTPTKRGQQQQFQSPSNSGSRSSGGARTPNGFDVHESPSKNHAQRRAARLPAPTPKKTPGFVGFANSFAIDIAPPSKSRPRPTTVLPTTHERTPSPCEMADLDVATTTDNAEGNQLREDLHRSRHERFVWAVAGLCRRRTDFLGLLLAHSTPRPLPPLSYPPSAYLPESIPAPRCVPDHTSTLHRLLNVTIPLLPADHPTIARQRAANDILLQSLTDGANNSDAERRFAFLHSPNPAENPPTTPNELVKMQEGDYWDCEEAIADGMQDLWDDLAIALRVLAGVYVRLSMMDAFQDAISLITSISVVEPQFINSLLMDPLPFQVPGQDTRPISVHQIPASQPGSRSQKPAPPPVLEFPDEIEDSLFEAVRKSSELRPIHFLSPCSGIPESFRYSLPAGTQWHPKMKTTAHEYRALRPWDMGTDQRENVLECVLGCIEILAWQMGSKSEPYLKPFFDAQAFSFIYLDTQRRPSTMRRFLSLLTSLGQYKDMWRSLINCRPDYQLQPDVPHAIKNSRTPLLELLAKHLVDLRHHQSPSDAHGVHCSIVTLLAQLVIKHSDALIMARESKSLFAALVQCIHTDTSAIWTDDGWPTLCRDRNASDAVVSRIVMDVRLLAHIFAPTPDAGGGASAQDLLQCLNSHESHLLLNGISHCFILAFNRLAFADEPSWMDEDCVRRLQEVADLSSDLIELVLSPDDVEAAWEVCGPGEEAQQGQEQESEQQEDMDHDEDMVASTAYPPRPQQQQRNVESLTQIQQR